MKHLKITMVLLLLIVPLGYAGLQQDYQPAVSPQPAAKAVDEPVTQLGDPLPGLDSEEMGRFSSGKFEFERVHTPEDGLGPVFNGVSCVSCHGVPATGGSMFVRTDRTIRFGHIEPDGEFDPLIEIGGSVATRRSIAEMVPGCNEPGQVLPPNVNAISFRFGLPIYGAGLIDAIPDETILANADPDDANHDGISGRPNIVPNFSQQQARVGRFDWKADISTLEDFASLAYIVELGITSPLFPQERRPNGRAVRCDNVADPEDDGRVVGALQDFMTFLAPPSPKTFTDAALRGQQIFADIGCVKCHIPSMRTGTLSERPDLLSPVLSNRDVPLYSDLLLHDMGDDLNDDNSIVMATGREWRTTPLWGVSAKRFLLHDGRTSELSVAITAHGGEAAAIRNRFLKLTTRNREDLLTFLRSL